MKAKKKICLTKKQLRKIISEAVKLAQDQSKTKVEKGTPAQSRQELMGCGTTEGCSSCKGLFGFLWR